MIESYLEKRLKAKVERLNGLCVKHDSKFLRGMPDRLVLMPFGKLYWVEVKSRKGRLSKIQEARHKELSVIGHNVWVIHNDDELKTFIKHIEGDMLDGVQTA